jgi:hypothetical protein
MLGGRVLWYGMDRGDAFGCRTPHARMRHDVESLHSRIWSRAASRLRFTRLNVEFSNITGTTRYLPQTHHVRYGGRVAAS